MTRSQAVEEELTRLIINDEVKSGGVIHSTYYPDSDETDESDGDIIIDRNLLRVKGVATEGGSPIDKRDLKHPTS